MFSQRASNLDRASCFPNTALKIKDSYDLSHAILAVLVEKSKCISVATGIMAEAVRRCQVLIGREKGARMLFIATHSPSCRCHLQGGGFMCLCNMDCANAKVRRYEYVRIPGAAVVLARSLVRRSFAARCVHRIWYSLP